MKLYIAGHTGLVGSALVRRLRADPSITLATHRPRRELDLTRQADVHAYLATEKPDAIIMAAAKVGGIHANTTYPGDFIYDNLVVTTNIVQGAHLAGVPRLMFLGSSCIYPKLAPQPIPETSLLTAPLEPTNEAYAIAKIAGLKLCEYYRKQYGRAYHSLMPTNLYGPGDNYHPQNSHVIPALIRRLDEARERNHPEVRAWGTGAPRREFLHVDDFADACAHLLKQENPPDLINIGSGADVTIRELTETIAAAVGYQGRIIWDTTKPDGTPRKLLDISKLTALGWRARIPLREGIEKTVAAYRTEKAAGKLRT